MSLKNILKKKENLTLDPVERKEIPSELVIPIEEYTTQSEHIKFQGKFSMNTRFIIKVYDSSSNPEYLFPSIYLESHLSTDNDGISYMHLDALKNETENDSELIHGLGCLMLQLLLTFIADFNENHQKKLCYISGTIKPIVRHNNGKTEIELQRYYSKRSGLTDTENRIKIVINPEECKKNNLHYDIHYVSNQK